MESLSGGLFEAELRFDIWQESYATCCLTVLISYYIKNQLINVIIFQDIILILMMMQRNKKKQEWSQEELQLLQTLYPQYTSKKWKRISEQFRCQGYTRSEIECREKWINFVDPSVNKNEWQEWELRRMYEIHAQMGSRWCYVQKQIGRTQNKIKNRFYGTLRNFIRFLLNYFDNGRSCLNYEITKLSPNFLNEMYNSQNYFFYLNGEVKNAIFAMGFKVEKKMLTQRVRENRSLYIKLHQFIISTFQSLSQQPHQSSPITSHVDQDKLQILEQANRQQDFVQEWPMFENFIKKEQQFSEALDLPRTSQNLQNNYLNQNYQNWLMTQYPQHNPTLIYYVLSYL